MSGSLSGVAAFFTGFITFFASCLLPLLPLYLGYFGGIALKKESTKKRFIVFKNALLFVLGFTLVFTLYGVFASQLGGLLHQYEIIFERIAAVILCIAALLLAEVLRLDWLLASYTIKVPSFAQKYTYLFSLFLGISFALSWTPCIGPNLALILLLAGDSQTTTEGVKLLLWFCLGISTPFLLAALFFDRLKPLLLKIGRVSGVLRKVCALFLLVLAFLLWTGQIGWFSQLAAQIPFMQALIR